MDQDEKNKGYFHRLWLCMFPRWKSKDRDAPPGNDPADAPHNSPIMVLEDEKHADLETATATESNAQLKEAVAVSPKIEEVCYPEAINWNETQGKPLQNKDNSDLNILLVGKIGVGKSTLLNSFHNYCQNETSELAKSQPLECIIPVQFSVFNEDCSESVVQCGSNIEGTAKEVFHDAMDSDAPTTQKCSSHSFQHGGKRFNFIDTPGITSVNKKQVVDAVKDHVISLESLHGICFVMRPNEGKADQLMENVMKELIMFFPRSIVDNVFILMTHSMGTFFGPGDTMQPLKAFAQSLKQSHNLDVSLKKDNIFCFDSEAFRYLCSKKNDVEYSMLTEFDYTLNWDKSKESMFRLLEVLSGKAAVDTRLLDLKQKLPPVIKEMNQYFLPEYFTSFPKNLKRDLLISYYFCLKQQVQLETDDYASELLTKLSLKAREKTLAVNNIDDNFEISEMTIETAAALYQKYFDATPEIDSFLQTEIPRA